MGKLFYQSLCCDVCVVEESILHKCLKEKMESIFTGIILFSFKWKRYKQASNIKYNLWAFLSICLLWGTNLPAALSVCSVVPLFGYGHCSHTQHPLLTPIFSIHDFICQDFIPQTRSNLLCKIPFKSIYCRVTSLTLQNTNQVTVACFSCYMI